MTIDEIIRSLQAENKEKESRKAKLTTEVRSTLDKKDATQEELDSADKKADEIRQLSENIEKNNKKIKNYQAVARGDSDGDGDEPKAGKPPVKRQLHGQDNELRDAINAYLHSKGTTRDGLTSPDADVIIPKDIVYNPENEVKTVTDLSKLVQHFQANTAAGEYPILQRATSGLTEAAELEKNPELSKPKFLNVSWKVKTYRGAIPISNEAIQDSAVDLLGIVSRNALEQKINTTNAAVAEKLKGFTPKNIAGEAVDDLKHIINVDLDPAYQKSIIASQSFYNWLDTLKDKDGRYLLQQPIVDGSPVRVIGIPIYVVEDDLLGNAGDSNAFIGDVKRAVVMADRLDIQVRWVDDAIYGQFLQAATRFDVEVADPNAGYFVSQSAGSTKKS